LAATGLGGTIIGSILLWVGAFIPETGGIAALYLFLYEAFLLVPCILTTISTFKQKTLYGLTITSIIFASINVLASFIAVCAVGVAYSVNKTYCDYEWSYYNNYYYSNYAYYYSNYNKKVCLGNKLDIAGIVAILAFQVLVLVMASVETRRARSTTTQQRQVIYITTPQMPPMQPFPTQFPGMNPYMQPGIPQMNPMAVPPSYVQQVK